MALDLTGAEARSEVLRRQAEECIAEERFDEAEAALRAAIETGDAAAMIDLGNLFLGFDRLDDAKELYRSASRSEDRAIAATGTINYAHVLGAEGQLVEAEALYRTVVASDLGSRSVDAMRSLGMLLVMEERLDEAEALYREVIAVAEGEDRAFAWLALGMVLVAGGVEFDAADVAFHRAIEEGSPEVAYGAFQALDELRELRGP